MRSVRAGGVFFLVLASASAPALAKDKYPFIGSWGGGPADCSAPFRFEASYYTPPGQKRLAIKQVKKLAKNEYRIVTAAKYSMTVQVKSPSQIVWLSGASGDTFELTRCK